MTDERRQEIRKWSAGVMGFKSYPMFKSIRIITPKEDWTPDLDTAPASQLLGFIEAMREKGYTLTTISGPDRKPQALFVIIGSNWSPNDCVKADTLPLAILEAGYATGIK